MQPSGGRSGKDVPVEATCVVRSSLGWSAQGGASVNPGFAPADPQGAGGAGQSEVLARAHGSRTHRRGSSPRPPVLKPDLLRIAECLCVQDVRPYAWDRCSSVLQCPVSVGLSASRTASSG